MVSIKKNGSGKIELSLDTILKIVALIFAAALVTFRIGAAEAEIDELKTVNKEEKQTHNTFVTEKELRLHFKTLDQRLCTIENTLKDIRQEVRKR